MRAMVAGTEMVAGVAGTDELKRYLRARKTLTSLEEQLDDPAVWSSVLDPAEVALDRLDDIVATLCHQARAAQQLATAAESLCAAIVGENHYCLG